MLLSPDRKTIAAGYGNPLGKSERGDAARPSHRRTLGTRPVTLKEGCVRSVSFSPDGKTIAAGSFSAPIVVDVGLRHLASERRVKTPRSQGGRCLQRVLRPDGKTSRPDYANAVDLGGVVLWDVAN